MPNFNLCLLDYFDSRAAGYLNSILKKVKKKMELNLLHIIENFDVICGLP